MYSDNCLLCQTPGGTVLWQNEHLRVIDVCDALYPGFTRVIWTAHVVEMTDLTAAEQTELLRVVLLVEQVQRTELKPAKVNLAAFGNVVPHLHWHVIPRWQDDPHFPQAVWAALPQADAHAQAAQEVRRVRVQQHVSAYHQALVLRLDSPWLPS
ncbi:MAG: diadenosine tetraphosphate hydrolase [Alcaligenaceae bacterium]|nr:MAG: diadenosine tetraphosphate hydrolase [Alcaligenaceae bacterium]